MKRRFRVRLKEMEAECQYDPNVFRGMRQRLRRFAAPFVACLLRIEQRNNAQTYLEGLVSDVERKNVESIAYRHDQERNSLQHFIGSARWNHAPLALELARQVGQESGEPDGVVVFDPSGFKKMGKHSVGVARQWLGRLGKVDNCQVGIYMGYASRKDHALVDQRLYLPKEWAKDKKRRAGSGVPKEIRYRTRHELALEMLDEKGDLLPHRWIAGDDEMGRSTKFRRALRAKNKQYVLAVPSNTNVRDIGATPPPYQGRGVRPKAPFQRVDKWRASLSKDAWVEVNVRDGEKGPMTMKIATTPVVARTERSRIDPVEELLVATITADENGKPKYDYYLTNAKSTTTKEELARVVQAERRVEECIKRCKSEAGLGDYEVRTWLGWHHHQILSMLATWFLILEARRGKKMGPRYYCTSSTRRLGNDAA